MIDNDAELLVEESPVNKEMVLKMLPKLDYPALLAALDNLREQHKSEIPELPATLPDDLESLDDEAVALFQKVLFDIHVMQGQLICPDTQRKFPIKDGIPNMILHEDEV